MHIDHFIPCAKFDLSDHEQQKECFNWMNLRLIPASANLSKNAKLPTKTEYMNHINMCLLFVDSLETSVTSGKSKQKEHERAHAVRVGAAVAPLGRYDKVRVFQLLHNTACRFFDMCYEDRCSLISSRALEST